MTPAQGPRLACEAERAIIGFTVYELPDGTWRAVHKRDQALVLEHPDWRELAWACVGARVSADLREAAEELATRMNAPSRTWRTTGPGGGINA